MNMDFRRRVMSGSSPGIICPEYTIFLCHFDGTYENSRIPYHTGETSIPITTLAGNGDYGDGASEPIYSAGYFKKALNFDGNTCIRLSDGDTDDDNALYLGNVNFTMGGWFKWDGTFPTGSYATLFSCAYAYNSSYTSSGFYVQVHSDGCLYWKVNKSYSNTYVNENTDVAMPVNEWCYVTLERYGFTHLVLTLNGKIIGAVSVGMMNTIYQPSGARFCIGAGNRRSATSVGRQSHDNFFSGQIDEFIFTNPVCANFAVTEMGDYNTSFVPPTKPYNEKKIVVVDDNSGVEDAPGDVELT